MARGSGCLLSALFRRRGFHDHQSQALPPPSPSRDPAFPTTHTASRSSLTFRSREEGVRARVRFRPGPMRQSLRAAHTSLQEVSHTSKRPLCERGEEEFSPAPGERGSEHRTQSQKSNSQQPDLSAPPSGQCWTHPCMSQSSTDRVFQTESHGCQISVTTSI